MDSSGEFFADTVVAPADLIKVFASFEAELARKAVERGKAGCPQYGLEPFCSVGSVFHSGRGIIGEIHFRLPGHKKEAQVLSSNIRPREPLTQEQPLRPSQP